MNASFIKIDKTPKMPLKPVFWLSLFVFVSLVSYIDCLKAEDAGACVVKISSRKTRNKLVTLSKWCGKKKCLVKKYIRETYIASKNQIICCKGWEYIAEENVCSPLCSTGCGGGRCIAPDQCSCEPPLTLHPELKNICISRCEPACFNAACINNTCHCEKNFTPYNTTHCFHCDEGYEIDEKFACKPQCGNCDSGHCAEPNVCVCDTGFNRTGDQCIPICDGCYHGQCLEPGVCSCDDGYYFKNGTCSPKCESCDNGECVAPNQCECREGFERSGGICLPQCEEPCVNGYCSSPNVCSCHEGFNKTELSNVCAKLCDSSCDGSCYGGWCAPSTCEPTLITEPIRNRPNRLQKNKYKCCQGYEFVGNKCKRECMMGCREPKYCSEQGICSCKPPLKENPITKICMEPICQPSCINADCVDFDVCKCKPGFFNINATYCAENCTLGYKNDPISYKCQPDCNPSCLNGMCTKPNECTCNDGYRKTGIGNECSPVCEPSCINGLCTKPNECTCNDGHRKTGIGNECSPVCDPPCINGLCTKPNECTCNDGYQKTGIVNECSPVCDPPCINGLCTKPNECTCNDGYRKTGIVNECKPICNQPCTNGKCIKPNECHCNEGYRLVDKVCRQICDPFCANVPCDSPYNCTCFSGYESTGSSNICKPKCANCDHGDCVGPNQCQCHVGYSRVHGICLPVCSEPCVNAICSQPDTCECFEGYIKNVTQNNRCYKPCNTSCDSGSCNMDGVCICDDGSQLINGSCLSINPVSCDSCVSKCINGDCFCSNGYPCFHSEEIESSLRRSAFAYTWLAGVIIGILLLVLVGIVMMKLWQKSQLIEEKAVNAGSFHESVVYTLPETLMNRSFHPEDYIEEECEDSERTGEIDYENDRNEASEHLMKPRNQHELKID